MGRISTLVVGVILFQACWAQIGSRVSPGAWPQAAQVPANFSISFFEEISERSLNILGRQYCGEGFGVCGMSTLVHIEIGVLY